MQKHNHCKGRTLTPTYNSWQKMRARCHDPKNNMYQYYGGRGVSVCDAWQSFENFLACMGERPVGTSLDRIDPDGDYEPGNCKWSTSVQQARNKRVQERNQSGFTGVVLRKDTGKWRSMIRYEGKLKHLGTFESFGDAVAARILAEEKYWGK